jgi:hypothetical protein
MQSNIAEFGNGRKIYERFVRPAMLDLLAPPRTLSARSSTAIASANPCTLCAFRVGRLAEGKKKLAIGQAEITSLITHAKLHFNFAVLYCGDHHLIAGISPDVQHNEFPVFTEQASTLFAQDDLTPCCSLIQHYFGKCSYSLRSLFHDERQRIITQLVEASLADIDELYRKTNEQHSPGQLPDRLHAPAHDLAGAR